MALHIRRATMKNYADFVTLWPALDNPFPPPLQPRWESEMMPTSFVAELDNNNKVSGYICWSATGLEGQVKFIMVDAEYRRRGVGTALMKAVAKELKERGCRRWRLHVRPENQSAVTLYRKFGLERCFGAAELHLTWDCVSRLPVEEGAAECRPVSPEEEADIEAAFGIFPGVFCEARELGGRIPLQLRSSDKNDLLGCCIFDPGFPGAYPFVVARPAYAKSLIEEMQKSRDPKRGDFFLLVENQEALVTALVEAGAVVDVTMDCFAGSL